MAGSTPRSGRATRPSVKIDVVGERVADDLGLLVDLLGHEMAVVALVDQQRACHRLDLRALNAACRRGRRSRLAPARQHGPVAVLQIGDRRLVKGASAMASEPRYISPSPWPMASGGPARAPIIRLSSPAKMMASAKAPRRRFSARLAPRPAPGPGPACRQLTRCRHRLGVGLGLEHVALGGELLAQLLEVLDDAVVHDGDTRSFMCGWALRSTGLPCVAQRVWPMPMRPCERLIGEPQLQVLELALGAAAVEVAVLDRGDAGGIIAAIFQPPQGIDEMPPPPLPRMPTMPHMGRPSCRPSTPQRSAHG